MKICSIITLATVVLLINNIADAKYSGGTGDPNTPYLIATPEDLNDIGNHQEDWDKYFILINDINLAQYTGKQFNIIDNFMGVFNGDNHIIENLTIDATGVANDLLGLFARIENGEVKNLGIEKCIVIGDMHLGGLVGVNSGIINNCYSTGIVAGEYGSNCLGGLVGYNEYGSIINCYSSCMVSGTNEVGGLVGFNLEGTIINCYSTGYVIGDGRVGGLMGYTSTGSISNCYSTGNVSGDYEVGGLLGFAYTDSISNCFSMGTVSGRLMTGGLVGQNSGYISNCYSKGVVIGTNYVGGLAGENYSGTITNSYSIGVVSTSYGSQFVGGLVGSNPPCSVSGSFWDTQTSGWMTSAGGTGKTTAEMKKLSTFTSLGWDFVEIWDIGENQTYPYLRTNPAGDLNHDKKIDFEDLAILALHWLEGL